LYTNYSVGFIPPSIGDLFRKDDVPLLDPSTFNNIELGGWIGLYNNKLFLDFAVYSLKGKDEVVSVTIKEDGITIRENRNVGETKHNGVEFGINYKPIEGLSIRYNGAYSKHEYIDFVTKIVDGEPVKDYSGNEMPGAPEWVTNAGIDYKPKAFLKGFRIGLEWQHVSEYFTDQENEYTYEGYDAFNARLGYDIKHFGFWMNVMNLSDKLYATRANTDWGRTTYTPGMPRTFIFGVNYKF
ncbi:MAG: TonB-dependent receptor, partial [Bacteroidetes bacterium]|nr:TonB-dependent receptor [Bacteroidota bacterium]